MSKYINFENNIEYTKLKEVATAIKNGKVVVFPTETVYGIGTNGLDEKAIEKLYKLKKRPKNKPISLLVNNMDMINDIAEDITELEYKLINKFMPGPLTIILKKKNKIPDILTANSSTVGIRIPENEIAIKLIEYANVPLATSSANISGEASGINLKNIMKDFNDDIDYYIDGGFSKIGIASTVVQVFDGIPHILRKGVITIDDIKKVVE